MSNLSVFLPDFGSAYSNPNQSPEEIEHSLKERREKMDAALEWLASEDVDHPGMAYMRRQRGGSCCPSFSVIHPQNETEGEQRGCSCNPPITNSVGNLAFYLIKNSYRVARSVLCCIPQSMETSKRRPIPQIAYETLVHTRTQFERNTCGLFCIAPATVAAAPFVTTNPLGLAIVGIFANLVIITTTGTSTYVFSGDIGVVSDGRNELVVEGGIRVSAILLAKNAYSTLSSHLLERWEKGDAQERVKLTQLSQRIADQWDNIFHGIADCSIKVQSVEDIMAPLSTALVHILRSAK